MIRHLKGNILMSFFKKEPKMAEEVKRTFELQIGLHIQETTEGCPTDGSFFDCPLEYHNLPYEGVVAIQKLMVGMLDDLTALGDAKIAGQKPGETVDKIKKQRGRGNK